MPSGRRSIIIKPIAERPAEAGQMSDDRLQLRALFPLPHFASQQPILSRAAAARLLGLP